METHTTVGGRVVRELPIVGGNLTLDFANTIDDPDGVARVDHIATYPGLLHWSARVGAVTPAQRDRLERASSASPDDATAALRQAHALRRVIGGIFTQIAAGGEPGPGLWPELQLFAADAITHAALTPSGSTYSLAWPDGDAPHAMLRPVTQAAVDLLRAPDLSRVKRCAGCPWLFLDRSKNVSRRWCAMSDCGTHEKIKRYVSRRAAARSS